MGTGKLHTTVLLGASISIAAAGACGGSGGTSSNSTFPGGDGSTDGMSSGSSGGGPDGSLLGDTGKGGGPTDGPPETSDYTCDGCAPFPGLDGGACSPQTLGPPTLVYPPDGVLLPPNMNVLEVQWVPPTGAALFEVDFENAATDVRVETICNSITSVRGVANAGCGLTLSQAEWNDISNLNRGGDPLKVTVRAAPASATCTSTSQQSIAINFAQENLTGGIYYWQSATYGGIQGTTGGIFYHDFGSFDPTPTPFWTSGATGTCVGCHTLTKSGVYMSLMNDDPDADDEFGDVKTLVLNVPTRTALSGANIGPGSQTFTHGANPVMVASTYKQGKNMSFAVWTADGSTQLATDPLPGLGTTQLYGTQPNLSEDDKTLVFVAPSVTNGMSSISQSGDHHFMGGSLWSASFSTANAPDGGSPTYGLSNFTEFLTATGQENFYYPDQSVDGNWVVLDENNDTSAANNNGDCFYSRQARVKIMHFPPQAGDQPLDLPNLDVADGLSNSWPRWSPALQTYKNHQILWVTFSSNRDYGVRLKNTGFDNYYPPESPLYDQPQPQSKQGQTTDNYAAPQIWMAAIIVDPSRSLDATDRSFPAFWLPFQDVTAHNHSAQWVNQVQGMPPSGDSGTGSSSGGGSGSGGDSATPACGQAGASCAAGDPLCCSDAICCAGTCATGCAQ